jgi:hypothetical protein
LGGKAEAVSDGGVFGATVQLVEESSGGCSVGCGGGGSGGGGGGRVFAGFLEFVFVFDLELDLGGVSSQHFGYL